jgi:hypothetical protein
MATWVAGQEVAVLPAYERGERDPLEPIRVVQIEKVGRTRVHVKLWGRLQPFHKENGFACEDPAQTRIVTLGQLAQERERRDLMKTLDVYRSDWWIRRTLEELRAIAKIVEEKS